MTAMPAIPLGNIPTHAVLVERPRPAALWEQGVVSLWVLLTFIVFPGNQFLLYPCALAFLTLFIFNTSYSIPVALKCSLLLMVPVLGVFSAGWSPVPAESFRAGAMMCLHFLIMVTIAIRLTRREIVRAVMFAGIVAIALAAPAINTFDQGGPYGSKNIFAIRMLIVWLAALAVALDPDENMLLRLLAVPVALVALNFNMRADSATALVLAIAGGAMLVGCWMIWQPASRIRHMRSIVLLFGTALLTGIVMIVLMMPHGSIVDQFLAAVGKDATLTNRTLFWEAGQRAAEQKPLFGFGLEAFWRWEVGAAQTLNELDHKAAGTKHSFHSTYVEARVALGLVGLTMLIIALGWTVFVSFMSWLKSRGDMGSSFFLTVVVIILVTTFTESYMLGTFDTLVLLFYLGATTAMAARYHEGRKQMVRLVPA